jgi:hypothetical protein
MIRQDVVGLAKIFGLGAGRCDTLMTQIRLITQSRFRFCLCVHVDNPTFSVFSIVARLSTNHREFVLHNQSKLVHRATSV